MSGRPSTGGETSDIKRLKELGNCKLKRLYADMALENAALKDVLGKNLSRPPSDGRS